MIKSFSVFFAKLSEYNVTYLGQDIEYCTMLLFGFLCQAIGIQCNLFGPSYWNTVQCTMLLFLFLCPAIGIQCNLFEPSFQSTMQLIWAKLSEFILVQCTLYNATFGVSLPSNWNTMLSFGFLCKAIGIFGPCSRITMLLFWILC